MNFIVSGGSHDAIVEHKGSGYKVGDRLRVDNSKTFGADLWFCF